jgi:hypothetical protein
MDTSFRARLGLASIAAGALWFAGQAGELVFGSPSELVDIVFILLGTGGFVALGVAFWELRRLVITRAGRVGVRIALAGMAFLALFSIQVLVEAVRTGDLPENFALFAFGFLFLLVAHLLVGLGLRRQGTFGRAWLLFFVAVLGILAFGIAGDALGPVHDVGLFVFEGAWVAFGVRVLRAGREAVAAPAAHPV